jgi:hypothetical protein
MVDNGGSNTTGTVADQLRNQVLSQLVTTLQQLFPQSSASISATATAGAATLPAAPTAFLTITVGSTSYKVALYKI